MKWPMRRRAHNAVPPTLCRRSGHEYRCRIRRLTRSAMRDLPTVRHPYVVGRECVDRRGIYSCFAGARIYASEIVQPDGHTSGRRHPAGDRMMARVQREHRLSHYVDKLLDRILLEPCWYTAVDHSGRAIGGSVQAQMNWRQHQKWMGIKPSQLDWNIEQMAIDIPSDVPLWRIA